MSALHELLGDSGIGAFDAAYPDRWLHAAGTAPTSMFGWPDLNQVLAAATLPCDWINIVVGGARTTPADLTELAEQVRAGHTLVVRHLERIYPQVARIAGALAAELGEPVAANLYVSQPGKQGFRLHYDSHDVLVVHLSGAKTWRICDRMVPYLVAGTAGNDHAVPDDNAPLGEPTLRPGDVLYLPRGQWHAAVADTESMHLTLGIYPRTGVDLLAFLTGHLRANVDLRRPAPPEPVGPTQVMGPKRRAHVADTLAVIRAALNDPDLVDAYARHLATAAQPRPRAVFPATADAPSTFTVASGLRLHTTITSEGTELAGYGASVTLPAPLRPLIDALTAGKPVNPATLAAGLDEQGRAHLYGAVQALRQLGWIEPDRAG